MKHELKREYKGQGITQEITPTCSCGWRGRSEAAWNDWQMTNLTEQESEHFAEIRRQEMNIQNEVIDRLRKSIVEGLTNPSFLRELNTNLDSLLRQILSDYYIVERKVLEEAIKIESLLQLGFARKCDECPAMYSSNDAQLLQDARRALSKLQKTLDKSV